MSQEDPYEFKFKKYASFDEENADFYRDLIKVTKSFFYNKNMTNIFITAMALGFTKDIHHKVKKPSNSIPTAVFTKEEKWLMISLYYKIHPKATVADLWQPEEILQNAEEYANGGIKFLKMIYEESEEPLEALEEEFRKYLE
jgi:hypothetical protein